MQSFLEFSEKKKITVKTKMGGEIPATIKVTGKDYHIVKADRSGKTYKVDHQGNSLEEEIELSEEQLDELKKSTLDSYITKAKYDKDEHEDNVAFTPMGAPKHQRNDASRSAEKIKRREKGITIAKYKSLKKEETDKDLPFTPDKPHKPTAKAGKYGSAYSTVRHLARQAMQKQAQKMKKEEGGKISVTEEQVDEAFINGREYASQGVIHPTHAKVHKVGNQTDFYAQGTGDKLSGKVIKNTGKEVHFQADKIHGGKVHKFNVSSHLPKPVNEDLQEATQSHKVNVTVSDPNHTAVSMRKEKQLKRVVVNATDKGDALAKAKSYYQKKGYKVHDIEHHSVVPSTTMKTEEVDIEEGYRGNSEADKPFFAAQDHKKAAEKARKSGDNFSYHKYMSAHHDAMEQWNSNKGRTHVANQHAMKADQHEDYAQQARKGASNGN